MENKKQETDGMDQAALDKVRQEIDVLDSQIQTLIGTRARLAQAVRE